MLSVRVPPGDGSDVAGWSPGVGCAGDGLAGSPALPLLTAVTIFHCSLSSFYNKKQRNKEIFTLDVIQERKF